MVASVEQPQPDDTRSGASVNELFCPPEQYGGACVVWIVVANGVFRLRVATRVIVIRTDEDATSLVTVCVLASHARRKETVELSTPDRTPLESLLCTYVAS